MYGKNLQMVKNYINDTYDVGDLIHIKYVIYEVGNANTTQGYITKLIKAKYLIKVGTGVYRLDGKIKLDKKGHLVPRGERIRYTRSPSGIKYGIINCTK